MSGKPLKQTLLLLALVGVLAFLLYRSQTAEPTGTAAPPSNPVTRASGAGTAQTPVTDVKLELLATDGESFKAPRRNPFRFKPKPVPVVRQPPPPPVVALPPPGPPPPPPISSSIRVIGIMVRDSGKKRVASLSDGTLGPPIIASEGDIVLGKFRLLRIDLNAVELAYVDGSARQRIPVPPPSPQGR